MHWTTNRLPRLLAGLTLTSLVLLAPGTLAKPSPDDKTLAPDSGQIASGAKDEVAPDQAIVSDPQSFTFTYCNSTCDHFWDWCVESVSDRYCILIDYEWCLTGFCPQPPSEIQSIEELQCCPLRALNAPPSTY